MVGSNAHANVRRSVFDALTGQESRNNESICSRPCRSRSARPGCGRGLSRGPERSSTGSSRTHSPSEARSNRSVSLAHGAACGSCRSPPEAFGARRGTRRALRLQGLRQPWHPAQLQDRVGSVPQSSSASIVGPVAGRPVVIPGWGGLVRGWRPRSSAWWVTKWPYPIIDDLASTTSSSDGPLELESDEPSAPEPPPACCWDCLLVERCAQGWRPCGASRCRGGSVRSRSRRSHRAGS